MQDAISYTYNDAGQVLAEAHTAGLLSGLTVTNAYNSLLQRTSLALKDSGGNLHSSAFTWDGAGRLSTVSDGTNSAAYSYLANSPNWEQITFKNDGNTRMTTTRTFDILNRLTAIDNMAGATPVATYAYAYNTANQRVAVTNANDSYWIYTYDELGQVISGKHYWSTGTPVSGQQFEYGFDSIGNRTTAKSGGDSSGANLRQADYTANNLNQYVSRTVPGYVDVQGEAASGATVTINNQTTYRNGTFYRGELPVGNGTSAVWFGVTNVAVLTDSGNPDIVTTEEGNVLVPKSPQYFSHDADGNLTADGRWLWSWNGENRLVQLVTHPLAEAAGKPRQKLEFAYDAQGRRISKVVYEWNGSAWVEDDEARFTYDGWNLVAELDDSLDATKTFTWGTDLSGSMQGAGGVGGLLFMGLGATGVHFVAFDGNGNVGALADEAAGDLTAKYEYSPFGKVCLETGTAVAANPVNFSTKYEDVETHLLGYGFRYLDPDTGRWPNRDPIGEKAFQALAAKIPPQYHYRTELLVSVFARNNPVSIRDYLGLKDESGDVTWGIPLDACPKGQYVVFWQIGYGGIGPFERPFVDDGSVSWWGNADPQGCPEYPNHGWPGNFEDSPGGLIGNGNWGHVLTINICFSWPEGNEGGGLGPIVSGECEEGVPA